SASHQFEKGSESDQIALAPHAASSRSTASHRMKDLLLSLNPNSTAEELVTTPITTSASLVNRSFAPCRSLGATTRRTVSAAPWLWASSQVNPLPPSSRS